MQHYIDIMKFVITGGPGVGKTTLLDAVARQGFTVIPEVARDIIARELPHGTLPWTDIQGFQRLVYDEINRRERVEGLAFCDRGIIDGIAYLNEKNLPIPRYLQAESHNRRYAAVFILDPLPTYATDAQRIESRERGYSLHNLIREAYVSAGYDPIRVPPIGIEARADFVLNHIKKATEELDKILCER
jgi:predicted ATPase